jgi:hypothetical protein
MWRVLSFKTIISQNLKDTPLSLSVHPQLSVIPPDGSRQQETHWSDFKEFTGGIWYPMNIKMYLRDVNEPVTIKIEEMDISPLTKEDFEFKFPALTHVTDHIIGTSYLTTMPLEQSGIEQTPLESSLSNKEKEEVLDKYIEDSNIEDSNTDNTEDFNITKTDGKSGSKPNIEEKTTKVPYWIIMLAFVFVVGAIIFVFTRRKKA